MTMIKQILKAKGRGYVSVSPNETVYAAIEKMAEKNIGSVLVMDGATLVGIFTERDYARNIVLKGRSSPQTPIKKVDVNAFCVRRARRYGGCVHGTHDEKTRAASSRH